MQIVAENKRYCTTFSTLKRIYPVKYHHPYACKYSTLLSQVIIITALPNLSLDPVLSLHKHVYNLIT